METDFVIVPPTWRRWLNLIQILVVFGFLTALGGYVSYYAVVLGNGFDLSHRGEVFMPFVFVLGLGSIIYAVVTTRLRGPAIAFSASSFTYFEGRKPERVEWRKLKEVNLIDDGWPLAKKSIEYGNGKARKFNIIKGPMETPLVEIHDIILTRWTAFQRNSQTEQA